MAREKERGHLPAALIYDGSCGFCRSAAGALARRDAGGLFELVALQDPSVPERFPALDPRALERAMHLVLPGGRVLAGADALPEILRRLPRWRWIAWTFTLPGALPLARRVYAFVAARRHRRACRTSEPE